MTFQNAHALRRAASAPDDTLKIRVVYTSDEATLSAMRVAVALAGGLPAKLSLVYPQIVPYPRPLTSSPVEREFTERRLRNIANQVPVESEIHVCLCRDAQDALNAELPPRSVVVIGGRKRWWPTAEETLARKLRRAGHEVIFTEKE